MFRAVKPSLRSSTKVLRSHQLQRSIYTLPELQHLDETKSQGLSGLYSPKGLETAWYSRGQHYVNNLNSASQSGDASAVEPTGVSHSLEHIISNFYNEPTKKQLYENASLLYNTKFAFDCLAPISDPAKQQLPEKATAKSLLQSPSLNYKFPNEPLNKKLNDWLVASFGSIHEFRTLLLNSALAIKGDGFVWLAAEKLEKRTDQYEQLFILNTYNAGQPSSKASEALDNLRFLHKTTQEQKALEKQKAEGTNDGAESFASENTLSTEYGYKHTVFESLEEAKNTFYQNKRQLVPVLAIDASPKAYLYDYGVFGKKNYLDRVWESIDWDKVASRLPERSIITGY